MGKSLAKIFYGGSFLDFKNACLVIFARSDCCVDTLQEPM